MIKAWRQSIQSSEFCCSATIRDKPSCWGRHSLQPPFSVPQNMRKHAYALKKWQQENKHRFDQCIILSTLSYFDFFLSRSIDTTS